MSVATEITRLQSAKDDLKTAINAKTDAQHKITNELISSYSTFVDSITTGGGGQTDPYVRPSDWLTMPTLDQTKDDIYILVGIGKNCINQARFKLSGSGTIDWGDGSNAETFTNASQTEFYHYYNEEDISSSTWTTHNESKQAIIHIQGNRNSITYFSTYGISYYYTNPAGTSVAYNSSISANFRQIDATVASCEVYFSGTSPKNASKEIEIVNWNGTISNSTCSSMFVGFYALSKVSNLNIPNCTSIGSMFSGTHIFEIPTITGNNITYAASAFQGCKSLQSFDTSCINLSKVTTTENMFYQCYSLKEVIGEVNIPLCTNSYRMFAQCNSLRYVGDVYAPLTTNASQMFYQCYSLTSVGNIIFRSVTNISQMWSMCYFLDFIPALNTKNVTSANSEFTQTYNLKKIFPFDASSFGSSNFPLNSTYSLQYYCPYNLNKNESSALTVWNNQFQMIGVDALIEMFNCLPENTNNYARTISLGATVQSYLANTYVKDSGSLYTVILPTSDTSIQSGKTYYTYDRQSDTFTQVTPNFSTHTLYFELVTATWNKYVICPSTDTGAMLALDFARNVKKYTVS